MVEAAGAFAGQHVLITGATGGIGSILAAKLAREGCNISAVSRHEDRLADLAEWIESLGGSCNGIPQDLTQKGAVEAVLEAADKFGPIDSVFCAAADFQPGPFRSYTTEDIVSTIRLDLLSPILFTKSLLPAMLKRGFGKICSIASAFGLLPLPYFSVHGATKAGLIGFCRSLAAEIAGSGVTVTCVAPRAVDTAMINKYKPLYRRLRWNIDSPENTAEEILKATALGKSFVAIGGADSIGWRIANVFPGIVQKIITIVQKDMTLFFEGAV